MTASPRRTARALLGGLALLWLAAVPRPASAELAPEAAPALTVAQPPRLATQEPGVAPAKAPDLTLDFDLLGAPAPPQLQYDDAAMKQRRFMLDLHQKVGLGLLALTLATTVVGQLNYNDLYGPNAPVTGKYQLTHSVLAFSTLGVFAVDGSIALFAPGNPVKKEHWDRMTVHKVGMATATAGMIAQGVVGVYASQQEGRIDQASIARTHLVIGYVTLAAIAVAVGALVF